MTIDETSVAPCGVLTFGVFKTSSRPSHRRNNHVKHRHWNIPGTEVPKWSARVPWISFFFYGKKPEASPRTESPKSAFSAKTNRAKFRTGLARAINGWRLYIVITERTEKNARKKTFKQFLENFLQKSAVSIGT